MKLAWLCYPHAYEDDDDPVEPSLMFVEPSRYAYERVIQIVYAEINHGETNEG